MTESKKILVVDDDRQVLRYLTEVLTEAGYDTTACDRFQDAKTLLATTRPSLLLTDIRLGAYNGLQLAIFGRDRHPNIPIIVLTGYEDPTLREEAAHSGALFLVKPVKRAILLASIEQVLGEKPPQT
ncbi:MAG TPA: response regulator [Vicinamibacterales bacterium]|jgi:DNA-binding NtrC family response regulator